MGNKLSKPPLYYTVAQVQFNPILDLEGYIPSLQARMREAKFPDYKKEITQRLVMPVGGMEMGQIFTPGISPESRHMFGDIQGRTMFLLETNAMSFQTTAYDTFETFSASFLQGLMVLHQALGLDFVERIGLRYLDAIRPPAADETLKHFLVPEVLGLSLRGEGHLQHAISETAAMTAAGQLITRVLVRHGVVGLPADLAGPAPAIDPSLTQHESLHAIIDTDASFTRREIFDLDNIGTRLTALHDEITKSFNAIVTPYAHAAWA